MNCVGSAKVWNYVYNGNATVVPPLKMFSWLMRTWRRKRKRWRSFRKSSWLRMPRLQTAETAVASLRLEAEQEKREADVLQRKLITSDARLETLQLAITRLEQRVEQAKCDADDQACELERVRIKNERLRQEAQRLEHDAETQQHQLDAFLSGMKVVTEAHEKEMDTLRQELDVQRNESAAVTCAMKDTHEMEMNILRQEVEVQQRKADCYGLEMEALKATREKEIGVLEREMQHQQRQLVQYGSDLELTAEELEHVRSELQDAKSHLDSTKEDLELARSERDQEQILRMESDGVVEDMRRECRAPFVVPALVNAFAEMSKDSPGPFVCDKPRRTLKRGPSVKVKLEVQQVNLKTNIRSKSRLNFRRLM
ncbi:hypothetical protein BT96DRAFT_933389 [Gymnopus androsaceus JB14]|uniref:Uncharacterized protein n=1 Tax=Gymnopus androsaceus JB14 TaxID=1447944 RepID=A0A6A4IDI5_9AGAR|nr:hypothetical protein BT96DRAFT_933389 [Gymnopus androsaceus JB14]